MHEKLYPKQECRITAIVPNECQDVFLFILTAGIFHSLNIRKLELITMAEQTSDIGLENLSPINPEIMQYQATINVGMV